MLLKSYIRQCNKEGDLSVTYTSLISLMEFEFAAVEL